MQPYSQIFKRAYYIAKTRKILWVLGMFLIGTFNVNFFHFREFFPEARFFGFNVYRWLAYFELHPGKLAILSASVLLAALGSLILTNLSRVLFLLEANAAIKNEKGSFGRHLKPGIKLLFPVIQISVITTVFMLAAAAVLVAPVMVEDIFFQRMLWALGVIIFFPLVFTISSINIFTGMFAVLFRLPVKKSLNAATDFFISNWTDLLGLTAVLLVIYLVGFGLGESAWLLLKFGSKITLPAIFEKQLLPFFWVFIIIKALGALALWLCLGALNAFVNMALLLFFLSRVGSEKADQVKSPVISPGMA